LATALCIRCVTRRIVFSGNNTTSNKIEKDCALYGMDPIEGVRRVRLVA